MVEVCEFYLDEINTPCVRTRAGDVKVLYGDCLRPIKELSAEQLLQARDCLEKAYGHVEQMANIPGGQVGLRKMLRGIRCWVGPNEDYSRAVDWPVLCLVVPEVEVHWGSDSEKKRFSAKVNSVDDWVRWVEAEINLSRCNLWRMTWGKINLRPEVRATPWSITSKDKLRKSSFQRLVNGISDKQFLCVFFFGPKSGKGKLAGGNSPFVLKEPIKNGTYAVWLPASEERMRTRGRFGSVTCFRKGKGLAHEFWHVVRHLLTKELKLKKRIFLPVINGTTSKRKNQAKDDFQKVKREAAELAIGLTPETRLQEYYAMWPTWRQASELAQRYR